MLPSSATTPQRSNDKTAETEAESGTGKLRRGSHIQIRGSKCRSQQYHSIGVEQ
jgi:hypothetical protein